MKSDKAPLSVAIITRNEEVMLPDCLTSVSFAEDIVVVDSGSTDRTVELAEEFGCRVFTEPWKGFGPQKQSAVLKCRHDWVLVLDADERIPDETKEAIIDIVRSTTADADAYRFPRKAYFNGRWIRHCGWWPDEIIRLFKKEHGAVNGRAVHERVDVQGTVKSLPGPIIHYPARDTRALIDKINSYSSLGAEELFKSGKRSSTVKAVAHAAMSFIKGYVMKKGFLDGKEGFIITLTGAATTFYKYIKLIEMHDSKNHG
jgi:glycosyltransferase involved in cell wall biosynthesis